MELWKAAFTFVTILVFAMFHFVHLMIPVFFVTCIWVHSQLL